MTVDLTAGIVRILNPHGTTAGAGFVVSDDGLIVTCAHVVAAALGIPEETVQTPAEEIRLDFPFVRSEGPLSAHVERWDPESDVAGLQLLEGPPAGARSLPLVTADDLRNHAIRDLELIQAADIEGLEPAFDLLESAEYEPDLPEDLLDILEDLN